MCNRHSFCVTRTRKILHGFGITDSHTTIRELNGLAAENDSVNAYEWQPPKGWPDADWNDGLTTDVGVFTPKKSHFQAMEKHIRKWYPNMATWEKPDVVLPLPEGLSVGGSLFLQNTGITSLPEGLTVGGTLDLRGCTGITSLPEGIDRRRVFGFKGE